MNDINIDKLIMDAVVPLLNEAFNIGLQAQIDRQSMEETLTDKKFYTPSGKVLKVYKEAWDAGHRSNL